MQSGSFRPAFQDVPEGNREPDKTYRPGTFSPGVNYPKSTHEVVPVPGSDEPKD